MLLYVTWAIDLNSEVRLDLRVHLTNLKNPPPISAAGFLGPDLVLNSFLT